MAGKPPTSTNSNPQQSSYNDPISREEALSKRSASATARYKLMLRNPNPPPPTPTPAPPPEPPQPIPQAEPKPITPTPPKPMKVTRSTSTIENIGTQTVTSTPKIRPDSAPKARRVPSAPVRRRLSASRAHVCEKGTCMNLFGNNCEEKEADVGRKNFLEWVVNGRDDDIPKCRDVLFTAKSKRGPPPSPISSFSLDEDEEDFL